MCQICGGYDQSRLIRYAVPEKYQMQSIHERKAKKDTNYKLIESYKNTTGEVKLSKIQNTSLAAAVLLPTREKGSSAEQPCAAKSALAMPARVNT
jgi:hypothetical protein